MIPQYKAVGKIWPVCGLLILNLTGMTNANSISDNYLLKNKKLSQKLSK